MSITIEYLWNDRKRYFGLPLSFTRYSLSEDRLFISEGFLTIKDQSNMIVLMFFSGLLPDCHILRLQSFSGQVFHKLGLEFSEDAIVCMIISFRESDVVSHEEDLILGFFCIVELSFYFI